MAILNTVVPGVYVQQASTPIISSSTDLRTFNVCYLVGTAAAGSAANNEITPITSVTDFETKAGAANPNKKFVQGLFDHYPNITLNFIRGFDSDVGATVVDHLLAGIATLKETDPLGILIVPEAYMDLANQADRTSVFTAADNKAQAIGLVHYADISDETTTNTAASTEADAYLASARYAALYYGGVLSGSDEVPGSVIAAAHTLRGFAEIEPFAPPAGKYSAASATLYPTEILDSDREILYPKRINTLKKVPGKGVTLWGTRTLSTGTTGVGDINTLIASIVVEKSAPLGFDVFQTKRDAEEVALEAKTRLTAKMNALYDAGALQGNVIIPDELIVNLYNRRQSFSAGTAFVRGFYVFDPVLVGNTIVLDFLYFPVGVYEQVLIRVSRVTI